MRNLILVLFIFLNSLLVGRQNPEYKSLILLGEKLAYNFEFDSCQSMINTAIDIAPERPEAYQIKSKIHLWYFLGSKEQTDYELFFDYSDSTVLRIDSLLEENDEDVNLLYLLGNVYKYRAMAYGNNGSTLDAFWATKKAVSLFESVLDLDSNYYSAYGGIGIFEYALSYVPALFNWALSLSGLSADQNNGFEYIKKASRLGEIDQIEYQFHLSKLYDEHLAEYDESIFVLKPLLREFPQNPLFHYQAAIEYIKSRELNKATKELEIVLQINHQKFIQTNSFSNFLLGDIYFRQNDYSKALEYYLIFLTSTQTIDYTGIASLRTAHCYYFLDNEKEFKRYNILAANGNLDLEDDKFAHEMSLFVLNKGFTDDRKVLVEVENSYLSGHESEALQIIENNLDSLVIQDIIAQVLHYKTRILIDENNIEYAKNTLEMIDTLRLESAEWIEPMSFYNLAEISYKENNFDMALTYLEEAEESNDFQKKNLIQSFINGLKRKLGNTN